MRKPIALTLDSSSRVLHDRYLRWSVFGRDRSLPHLERKFYHLVMGLFCFSLYAFVLTREQALLTLAVIGIPWLVLDISRLWLPDLNQAALRVFGSLMRREEMKSISGNSFYILGLFAITFLFPKPIVLMSVLCLAVGDPTAAVVGTLCGRHKILGKKSAEGSLGNFLFTSLAILALGLGYFGLPPDKAIRLAWVGGAASVISELLPLPIDDNFTIPVVSAALLSLVCSLLPIL